MFAFQHNEFREHTMSMSNKQWACAQMQNMTSFYYHSREEPLPPLPILL
jgi:hypothetical protein